MSKLCISLLGIALAQSQAILRYLGRKYNLMGDSETEASLIDMIGMWVIDLAKRFTLV